MNNDITLADVGLSYEMIWAADILAAQRKASGDTIRLEFGKEPATKVEITVVRTTDQIGRAHV